MFLNIDLLIINNNNNYGKRVYFTDQSVNSKLTTILSTTSGKDIKACLCYL